MAKAKKEPSVTEATIDEITHECVEIIERHIAPFVVCELGRAILNDVLEDYLREINVKVIVV